MTTSISRSGLLGLLAAASLGGGLVGAGGAIVYDHQRPLPSAVGPALATPLRASPPAGLRHDGSLADMVQTVAPEVVQVQVRTGGAETSDGDEDGTPQSPEDLFRRFFGGPHPRARSGGAVLGSGFVIDTHGYVVTNAHVVADADRIRVKLSDGREVAATLVGRDEKTDLAVLKIDPVPGMAAIAWGDSDALRVGDNIFAVGSPFGLGNTVTSGIVSGRGREIGEGPYDDFLQVDAAINQGNSGGPLFDSSGHVVGVNTAIYSPSGGNVGIGFAIPSRLAQGVVRQLVERGQVTRAQLGVAIQPVTPELAQGLGLKSTTGALVADVSAGSAAERAGIRRGDVIVAFNDSPVADARALSRMVAESPPGARASVIYVRDGQRASVAVTPTQASTRLASAPVPAMQAPDAPQSPLAGLSVATVPGRHGVVVLGAEDDVADAGLAHGDHIVAANGRPVASPKDLFAAVATARAARRDTLVVEIERGATHGFVALPLS